MYALARSAPAASFQGSVKLVWRASKKKSESIVQRSTVVFCQTAAVLSIPTFPLDSPLCLIAAPFTLQQLSVPQMWVSRLRFPKKKKKVDTVR